VNLERKKIETENNKRKLKKNEVWAQFSVAGPPRDFSLWPNSLHRPKFSSTPRTRATGSSGPHNSHTPSAALSTHASVTSPRAFSFSSHRLAGRGQCPSPPLAYMWARPTSSSPLVWAVATAPSDATGRIFCILAPKPK
jgi:hypothetical protein